ncbi:kinetochore-associated Ndc80 complex subunit spc25 [Tulasnella sp. 403]|nr:kinetochore-associated Ndc80 complex subunit spc25 [Tulasnella sp. 403]
MAGERLGHQPVQLMALLQNTPVGATPSLETHYAQCATTQGAFMIALQNYVTKAKEEIKARKELFTKRQQEDEERKKEMEREIEECAVKEVKMIEQVKRERAEVAELEAHVAALEKQQATTRENFVRKDDEIEELKKKIITRRGALSRDREILETHARRAAREAKGLEDALGWSIEGIQMTSSRPLLGTLPTLIEDLNATRELYVFVRRLREAFQMYVEDERRYKGGLA